MPERQKVHRSNTLGISGTPSFVIGKTAKGEIAGVRIVGAVRYAVFDSTIKDPLSSKQPQSSVTVYTYPV